MAHAEVRLEWAVPEAQSDLLALDDDVARIALSWLGRARRLAAAVEECEDRPWPLDGCVKLRFGIGDEPWRAGPNPPRASDPQCRLVLEYLPSRAKPERLLVWAVALGHPPRDRRVPDAYALAGRRRTRRLVEDVNYRKEARR